MLGANITTHDFVEQSKHQLFLGRSSCPKTRSPASEDLKPSDSRVLKILRMWCHPGMGGNTPISLTKITSCLALKKPEKNKICFHLMKTQLPHLSSVWNEQNNFSTIDGSEILHQFERNTHLANHVDVLSKPYNIFSIMYWWWRDFWAINNGTSTPPKFNMTTTSFKAHDFWHLLGPAKLLLDYLCTVTGFGQTPQGFMIHGWSTYPPGPRTYPHPRNMGLIFGLIKGNQWVFISPDHKAGYVWGGEYVARGGRLTSHWYKVLQVGLRWWTSSLWFHTAWTAGWGRKETRRKCGEVPKKASKGGRARILLSLAKINMVSNNGAIY